MQLVEQHRIDRHDPRWPAIDAAAFASKYLYNAALYLTRQAFIHEGRRVTHEDLARDMKTSAEYRALPAKAAQWALRQVALAWMRYFAACAAWEANPSRFLGHPQLPKYLDKRGRHLLTYTEQAISRAPKNRRYGVPSGLPIRVATRRTAIDQVRIVPHASHDTVEVIYERPVTPADSDPTRRAAIASGWNNLAAVTFHQPGMMPLLVTGRPLKAINQWYNNRRAHLQAKLTAGVVVSRPLDLLADNRARQITGYLHGASRRLVDWLGQRIGMLIMDKNDGWKQAICLGKRTTQSFVFAPPARFIEMLRYQAELVGLPVQTTVQSYTSQASFLDGDPLPVYDPAKPEPLLGGRRDKGGWAADGRRNNADVTGAYTILRTVVPNAFGNGREGVVVHPVRIPWRMGHMAAMTLLSGTILKKKSSHVPTIEKEERPSPARDLCCGV